MRFFLSSALFALALMTATAARADIWVWEDPGSHLTVTFPDTWQVLNNSAPDDVLRIVAAGNPDQAICRVRVREDRRFLIYPTRYMSSVQQVAYSKDFWEHYVDGDYNLVNLDVMQDKAGLGRGFASMAVATFDTAGNGTPMRKRGLMFASLYNDKAYVVDCSADAQAYDRWANAFLEVVKSVDFKKVYNEIPTGHYRDFFKEQ